MCIWVTVSSTQTRCKGAHQVLESHRCAAQRDWIPEALQIHEISDTVQALAREQDCKA